MPKDVTIQSILVIGSGPIVIGQAAEFDYSGTQGCRALREEGYKVILVNNNPATIMTDEVNADIVYFEPLTVTSIEKIIEKERPDGILATLGGQTGLNLAYELDEAGILEKYNVKMLGTSIESIKNGEDRESFRNLMNKLCEPVPESKIVTTVDSAVDFAEKIGYPIIIRPAYTLGGTGGGIATNLEQLINITKAGLSASPITQCLIEKSIAGYKEIEYEVMRDSKGTCITICNMENIDPVGIHTGDSIVVAPSQTLTDEEYQMLRTASIKIISALGIIGGCNIQFALDPNSKNYYLIEVNPRVSRSSALASKATGYPIAKMAAKLAVGFTLDELINPVTGNTFASFEPSLDYVVVKFPRFPFDKFPNVSASLGTQMKATGEVMAIDRNLEGAIQKAVQSLEGDNFSLSLPRIEAMETEELFEFIKVGNEARFFCILELIRRGVHIDTIHSLTLIDKYFLYSFQYLIEIETEIKQQKCADFTVDFMKKVKELRFSDDYIGYLVKEDEAVIRHLRKKLGVVPSYKCVDTCAGEFTAQTPYYYSSYFGETELEVSAKQKVLIIGSGPIRIGQGIEFDYSSVHGILSLQEEGYETILINNNPETVSTDFEIADKLFFEPLSLEDVLNVIEAEQIDKVIVQFGGQTSINLAKGLEEAGITILGTSQDIIDQLEDRDRFYQLLDGLTIPHLPGEIANDSDELYSKAGQIGYPILLRPSYVIGGKGMVVIHREDELTELVNSSTELTYPILIDAFVPGLEFEIDLLTDGNDILIPTVVEHIEKAGVHSGDSHAVLPAISITNNHKQLIEKYAKQIANELSFVGIMNIQFVMKDDEIFVLEINPRASRTVPIVSKVTGIPMIQFATKLLLGKLLEDVTEWKGILDDIPYYAVKFPVFSTNKLAGDPTIGPEMKSTGEGISIASTVEEAYLKIYHAYLNSKKEANELFVDVADFDELETVKESIQQLHLNIRNQDEFTEWVKQENALALLSLKNDAEATNRKIAANQQRNLVFTKVETFEIFLKAMQQSDFTVTSIQVWNSLLQQQKGVYIN